MQSVLSILVAQSQIVVTWGISQQSLIRILIVETCLLVSPGLAAIELLFESFNEAEGEARASTR
jgi:hypothetical protein